MLLVRPTHASKKLKWKESITNQTHFNEIKKKCLLENVSNFNFFALS